MNPNGEEKLPSLPENPLDYDDDTIIGHPELLEGLPNILLFQMGFNRMINVFEITGDRDMLPHIKKILDSMVKEIRQFHGSEVYANRMQDKVQLIIDRLRRGVYEKQLEFKLKKRLVDIKLQQLNATLQLRQLQVKEHRQKGNIRLMIRVRPKKTEKVAAKVEGGQLKVMKDVQSKDLRFTFNVGTTSPLNKALVQDQWQTIDCDSVFDESSKQEDVFIQLEPYITNSMLGEDTVLFCNGPTGTGKTFTIFGSLEETEICPDSGLLLRCLADIFKRNVEQQLLYRVTVSAYEVDSTSNRMFASPCKSIVIEDIEQALCVVKYVFANKLTEKTNKNDNSSMSHIIFVINFKGERKGKVIDSHLVIVDLAGNENFKNSNTSTAEIGTKMKNKSLAALTKFMMSFKSKESIYFNPKEHPLTYLLSKYFNPRTLSVTILTISPDEDDLPKTRAALAFAKTFKL